MFKKLILWVVVAFGLILSTYAVGEYADASYPNINHTRISALNPDVSDTVQINITVKDDVGISSIFVADNSSGGVYFNFTSVNYSSGSEPTLVTWILNVTAVEGVIKHVFTVNDTDGQNIQTPTVTFPPFDFFIDFNEETGIIDRTGNHTTSTRGTPPLCIKDSCLFDGTSTAVELDFDSYGGQPNLFLGAWCATDFTGTGSNDFCTASRNPSGFTHTALRDDHNADFNFEVFKDGISTVQAIDRSVAGSFTLYMLTTNSTGLMGYINLTNAGVQALQTGNLDAQDTGGDNENFSIGSAVPVNHYWNGNISAVFATTIGVETISIEHLATMVRMGYTATFDDFFPQTQYSAFTFVNTAPTATIVFPTNGDLFASRPLAFNISTFDFDGDNITQVDWYINGTLNQTTTHLNTTFNASDNHYNLSVTVFDGTDFSENVSIFFVLDTSAPVVTLSPVNTTPFNVNINITCQADNINLFGHNFTLYDGDSITDNIITSIELLNLSIPQNVISINLNTSFGDKRYLATCGASDDHTANIIPDYAATPNNEEKKITFDTGTDIISITQVDAIKFRNTGASNIPFPEAFASIGATRSDDESKYHIEINYSDQPGFDYFLFTYDITSTSEIFPRPNNGFAGALVTGINWIDWEPFEVVSLTEITPFTYRVIINTTTTTLVTDSIGGVNQAFLNITYEIDTIAPSITITIPTPDNLTVQSNLTGSINISGFDINLDIANLTIVNPSDEVIFQSVTSSIAGTSFAFVNTFADIFTGETNAIYTFRSCFIDTLNVETCEEVTMELLIVTPAAPIEEVLPLEGVANIVAMAALLLLVLGLAFTFFKTKK